MTHEHLLQVWNSLKSVSAFLGPGFLKWWEERKKKLASEKTKKDASDILREYLADVNASALDSAEGEDDDGAAARAV